MRLVIEMSPVQGSECERDNAMQTCERAIKVHSRQQQTKVLSLWLSELFLYNWTLVISYINVKLISTGQTSLIDTLSLPLSLSLSLSRRNGLRKLRQERISQQSGAKSQKCQSCSVSSNDFLQLWSWSWETCWTQYEKAAGYFFHQNIIEAEYSWITKQNPGYGQQSDCGDSR